ncbi:MAG: GxxExxY protein [Phycisphaerales bacterium]|nr:GxxExxY protein [Planctomycetota bacterium]MCH8507960.1 GxxExxY protein [Phycisphaerales bacterium]
MTATAIILARAGSKGLPGKNVAGVCGIPCIIWTIEHALTSETVSRVVVSSDDPAALAMARIWGVEIIERPPELAHDTARIDDAARHAFQQIGEPDGPVAILYANVPVRPDDLTDRAVRLLLETGCDSVQSYTGVGKYHPWWMTRVDETTGSVRPWEGEVLNHGVFRRQDLPSACVPDGGVIVCTPDALMLRRGAADGPHAFFGVDRRGVMTGEGEVVDIDSAADLALAESLLAGRRRGRFTTESTESTEGQTGGMSDGALRDLTHRIIGCAMKVHSAMGPGLLESVYEMCLADELTRNGLRVRRQVALDIEYGGRTLSSALRLDMIIEDALVLELKAVERILPVHEAQLLSYLRLSRTQVGLIINFHVTMLKNGIKRLVIDPGPSVSSVPSVNSVVKKKTP